MSRFGAIALDEEALQVVEPLFVVVFIPRVIQLFMDPLSFGRLYAIAAVIMLAFVVAVALRAPSSQQDGSSNSKGADTGALQVASLFVLGASIQPAFLSLASMIDWDLLTGALLSGAYLAACLLLACGRKRIAPLHGCLAFYALGALFWNVLTRMFAFEVHAGWILFALLAPVSIRLFAKLLPSRIHSKAVPYVGDSSLSRPLFKTDAHVELLTDREQQVLANMLSGYSSALSAQKLGLKSSTVREYLRRSYKKLGVVNAGEAKRLLLSNAEESHEKQKASTVPADSHIVSKTVADSALFTAAAFLTIPSLLEMREWSVGDPALYSMAQAALWVGFARMSGVRVDTGGRLCQGSLASLAVVSIVSSDFHSRLFLLLDTLFYAILANWIVDYLVNGCRTRPSDNTVVATGTARLRAQCTLAFCFILLTAYALLPQIQYVLEKGMIVVASLVLFGQRVREAPDSLDGGVMADESLRVEKLDARCMVFGAISGLACEEIWRSAYWFSFMPAALSFLIPVALACVILLCLRSKDVRAGKLLPVLFGIAAVCSLLFLLIPARGAVLTYVAAQTILVAALVLNCFDGLDGDVAMGKKSSDKANAWVSLTIGWGTGVLVGLVGINMVGEVYTSHVDVFGVYGNQTGFELFTAFVSALVFAATGLWFAYRICKRGFEAKRGGVSVDGSTVDDDEVEARLRSIGMTDLQVQVAIATIRGASVGEIATTLGYSRSAVRQARLTCYRVFSVHSASALKNAIIAGKSYSQSQ